MGLGRIVRARGKKLGAVWVFVLQWKNGYETDFLPETSATEGLVKPIAICGVRDCGDDAAECVRVPVV